MRVSGGSTDAVTVDSLDTQHGQYQSRFVEGREDVAASLSLGGFNMCQK